ncbi:hypothetical protein BN1263460214 [Stenotrophomonas indicatrix]|nr:hypothetical protein BN1263460214 [Stenotrophomonas indicatrix]
MNVMFEGLRFRAKNCIYNHPYIQASAP